jgi:hypothetical protein
MSCNIFLLFLNGLRNVRKLSVSSKRKEAISFEPYHLLRVCPGRAAMKEPYLLLLVCPGRAALKERLASAAHQTRRPLRLT